MKNADDSSILEVMHQHIQRGGEELEWCRKDKRLNES
jgi:hypothetical protein